MPTLDIVIVGVWLLCNVHAGTDMDWNSIMHAAFGAHFGVPVEEFLLALVGGVVGIGTGRAEVVVGDDFQDVGRAKFANSAVAVEWVVVGLEVFDMVQGRIEGGGLLEEE